MPIVKIGRYQIKREIGRGGMAAVFHAYDPSFERDVAVKVLPFAFLHDPQFRTRFEREAKMIALLEHPAIVPVYDFGEEEDQPFIVMRYMAGGSLDDRLKNGAISAEDTARIITRLAPALDAAHARGIIHRDLKPGNILFDQYGNAFLSDFGIARLAQQESLSLTGTNIVGTPAYMSPEQIQGEKEIDGRSDIYALGVLIYQMLTGLQPYRSETAAKVMMMHVLDPVPDIRIEGLTLPPGCEAVIARAMAKERDERYATTADLASELEAVAKGEGLNRTPHLSDRTMLAARTLVSARPPGVKPAAGTSPGTPIQPAPVSAPAKVLPRRRPWLWLVLALVVIGGALLVATGGLVWLGRQGQGPLAGLVSPPTATLTAVPSATALPPEDTPTPSPVAVVLPVESPTSTPNPLPTETPVPSPTPTETTIPQPLAPVIGGSDKIAYLRSGDIWAANLDGSELVQLTTDGTLKTDLSWTPDGLSLTYITGKCVYRIDFASGRQDLITCFNFVDTLKSFQISPDMDRVALSLDNQLYIVPFDPAQLSLVNKRTGLTEMSACKDFAPYQKNYIVNARWSKDSNILAVELLANIGNGRQGNIIQLFRVDECIPNPRALDNFPPPRFEMAGYDKQPVIQSFAWDGLYLFAINNLVRNDGFGDLYLYNTDLHKAESKVNPVDNTCCYRDAHFSPDGSHLVFAFQNYLGGANSMTQLYLIPFGSIGTGATYEPLPLPPIMDPRERPQPVLRPTSSPTAAP